MNVTEEQAGPKVPETTNMPPPRRGQKDKKTAQSVYTPKRVGVVLGGFRSSCLGQAVLCWGKVLEQASLAVAGQLKPGEWAFLAEAAAGKEFEFDPEWSDPGNQLAQTAERGCSYELGLHHLHKDRAKARDAAAALAKRLRDLEYVHAWAVITALQWRADHSGRAAVAENEEWWTLAHRQRHIQE
jgi:hypothetical protein